MPIVLYPESCCDFCSIPGRFPEHIYIARHVLSGELETGQTFEDCDLQWAACPVCHELIETKKWKKLADRAVQGTYVYPREGHDPGPDTPLHRLLYVRRLSVVWHYLFGWPMPFANE
jgi:hypothetical protein